MSIAIHLTGTWAGEPTPEGVGADEAATAADHDDPSGDAETETETVELASEDLGGRVQLDLPAIDLGGWTWDAPDMGIAVPGDEFVVAMEKPAEEGESSTAVIERGDDELLVAGPNEDVFDFGPADDTASDPVDAGDGGQIDDPFVPGDIDFTITLMPFDPVICILIVDPVVEELPVVVICQAPIEEPGQLYYGEAICGLTDAAIPVALAI